MGLIQMSFMGGIFILAVMALRALLLDRLPKKTFYMLWLAVLIRLLAPFSLVSPASGTGKRDNHGAYMGWERPVSAFCRNKRARLVVWRKK